jgi:hypothetical protein
MALVLVAYLGLVEAPYPWDPVDLQDAGNYLILTTAAISCDPPCALTGDIAISPAAASGITGLLLDKIGAWAISAQVTGKVYAADYNLPTPAILTQAVLHKLYAYNDAAGRVPPDFINKELGLIGGLTLEAGLYKWTTVVSIASNIYIDGEGDPDAVWIFQISGYFEMKPDVEIILINGAQAKNIFWQIAGYVQIQPGAHLQGIVLCATVITFQSFSSFNGRLYAVSVVMDKITGQPTTPQLVSTPTSDPTMSPTLAPTQKPSLPTSAPTVSF